MGLRSSGPPSACLWLLTAGQLLSSSSMPSKNVTQVQSNAASNFVNLTDFWGRCFAVASYLKKRLIEC